MSVRTPSYRLHKPTGRAVVTLNGHDVYLGKHGSAESRAEFDRIVAEWLTGGRQPVSKSDLTISELMVAFIHHCDSYYIKDGEPTSEARLVRDALKTVKMLYAHTLASAFGPLSLKTVRAEYVAAGLARASINKRVGRVVRMFRWAVENEMVPASVHHGLVAVAGLRRGRSEARETAPVRPVPDAFVDAIQPHVNRRIWAMIELQRLTGARPGEICIMRTCDLNTTGRVWTYVPESHKTQHLGRERIVYIGPRAQAVLKPWLKTDLDAFLFSPDEATAELLAARRQARKSPVQPSQRDRRKPNPKKRPGTRYTPDSYRHAVGKACALAGVPKWHPHQLRHNAATRLRREHGLEVSRVILGHTSMVTTEIYAEQDREKALEVMAQVG